MATNRIVRWVTRIGMASVLGAIVLVRTGKPERPREVRATHASIPVEEREADHDLASFANEVLRARPQAPSSLSAEIDRFERESDPEALAGSAIDLNSRLHGADEARMVKIARSGDPLHQEHALPALMNHSGESVVAAALKLADPAGVHAVVDRSLDVLLSVADELGPDQRQASSERARLLANAGVPTLQATALHLLAELGTKDEDRPLLEALAVHPDLRVSLAARRALVEYMRVHGDHDRARRPMMAMTTDTEPVYGKEDR